jgi:GT2 family glycosyltransferase
MMVPKRVFEDVDGFDERLVVAFNDTDFCLRLLKKGYLIVYTPHAVLYHHESASRGGRYPASDERLFVARWQEVIGRGDEYYNPNLTLIRDDWSLRVEG